MFHAVKIGFRYCGNSFLLAWNFFVNLYKEYTSLKSRELEELPRFVVMIWQPFMLLRIYLFEIKRVRRITTFCGNDLATVHVAAVCIALLVSDNSLYAKV